MISLDKDKWDIIKHYLTEDIIKKYESMFNEKKYIVMNELEKKEILKGLNSSLLNEIKAAYIHNRRCEFISTQMTYFI